MSRGQPSWKLRRRAVFASLVFAWAIIVYVAIRWDDTSLAQTLVLSAFASAATVIAAYIGGAAYEDTRLYQPRQIEETTDAVEETVLDRQHGEGHQDGLPDADRPVGG